MTSSLYKLLGSGTFGAVFCPPLIPRHLEDQMHHLVSKVSTRHLSLRELLGAQQLGRLDPTQQVSIQPVTHLAVHPDDYQQIQAELEQSVDILIDEPYQIIYPHLGYTLQDLLYLDLLDPPAWSAFQQVVRGLLYFNKFGVLHLDVKLDNIMIGHLHRPEDYQGRLIDYGLVTPMTSLAYQPVDTLQQAIGQFSWLSSCYAYWTPAMYALDDTLDLLEPEKLDELAHHYVYHHPMTEWMGWTSWEIADYLQQLRDLPPLLRTEAIATNWDLYSLGVCVFDLAQHCQNDHLLYLSEQLVDLTISPTKKQQVALELCQLDL